MEDEEFYAQIEKTRRDIGTLDIDEEGRQRQYQMIDCLRKAYEMHKDTQSALRSASKRAAKHRRQNERTLSANNDIVQQGRETLPRFEKLEESFDITAQQNKEASLKFKGREESFRISALLPMYWEHSPSVD